MTSPTPHPHPQHRIHNTDIHNTDIRNIDIHNTDIHNNDIHNIDIYNTHIHTSTGPTASYVARFRFLVRGSKADTKLTVFISKTDEYAVTSETKIWQQPAQGPNSEVQDGYTEFQLREGDQVIIEATIAKDDSVAIIAIDDLNLFKGASEPEHLALGMGSTQHWWRISSEQLNVSSERPPIANGSFQADNARLNTEEGAGAWCPMSNDQDSWIQVDFVADAYIYGIVIQGRASVDEWVETFSVSYWTSEEGWKYITDADGNEKIFVGSYDSDTPIHVVFDEPINVQLVRIYPVTWHNEPCLRIELIGYKRLPTTDPVEDNATEGEFTSEAMTPSGYGTTDDTPSSTVDAESTPQESSTDERSTVAIPATTGTGLLGSGTGDDYPGTVTDAAYSFPPTSSDTVIQGTDITSEAQTFKSTTPEVQTTQTATVEPQTSRNLSVTLGTTSLDPTPYEPQTPMIHDAVEMATNPKTQTSKPKQSVTTEATPKLTKADSATLEAQKSMPPPETNSEAMSPETTAFKPWTSIPTEPNSETPSTETTTLDPQTSVSTEVTSLTPGLETSTPPVDHNPRPLMANSHQVGLPSPYTTSDV
ncbi:uncharacterized protein LOC119724007, partial [Patiria miniata]|uniref:F5/8 type C domain-containing protein n=1 Tax=Patiria miniata TaxID=46514 RepID=A0A913ZII6_PATMI